MRLNNAVLRLVSLLSLSYVEIRNVEVTVPPGARVLFLALTTLITTADMRTATMVLLRPESSFKVRKSREGAVAIP